MQVHYVIIIPVSTDYFNLETVEKKVKVEDTAKKNNFFHNF